MLLEMANCLSKSSPEPSLTLSFQTSQKIEAKVREVFKRELYYCLTTEYNNFNLIHLKFFFSKFRGFGVLGFWGFGVFALGVLEVL